MAGRRGRTGPEVLRAHRRGAGRARFRERPVALLHWDRRHFSHPRRMTMHTPSDGGPVASQDAWRLPFVKQHQQWCDDFVIELRMRVVTGAVISDLLNDVQAKSLMR